VAETGFIKFDPVKLLETGKKLEQQKNALEQSMADIKRQSDILKTVWKGGGADEYYKKVEELDRHGADMGRLLLAFSQNLTAAAGVYEHGETRARQKAEALPVEGVFRV
jgi:WXG100 family type VII secretion target